MKKLITCPQCKHKFSADEFFKAHQKREDELAKELNKQKDEIVQLQKEKEELNNQKTKNKEKIIDEFKKTNNFKEITKKLVDQETADLKSSHNVETKQLEKASERKTKKLKEFYKQEIEKLKNQPSKEKGEIQELVLEDFLNKFFPMDRITPIDAGVQGGDCIQTIVHKELDIGGVYYESKNVPSLKFKESDVKKLFIDMGDKNIGIGIIVSQTMPDDYKGGFVIREDGQAEIIICPFNSELLKAIAKFVRKRIIKINFERKIDSTPDEAWMKLKNTLASPKFQAVINNLYKTIIEEKTKISTERSQSERNFKRREKNLNKIDKLYVDIITSFQTDKALPDDVLLLENENKEDE